MDVDDIGTPVVWFVHLSNVEEDWLGVLAVDLLLRGSSEEVGHNGPEGILCHGGVVALHEVEGSRSVGGSTCEGSSHGGGAGLDNCSIGKREAVPLHVVEEL